MLDLLCQKSVCGDLDVNLARRLLDCHEWGRVWLALERGMAKGRLSEPEQVRMLMQEVCDSLSIKNAGNLWEWRSHRAFSVLGGVFRRQSSEGGDCG